MKVTFITLLVFSLCLPAVGADEKTDVEEAGYKGRVKSVKVSSFDIEQIDGKLVRTGLVFPGENITKYDEKGNKVKKTSYDFFLPTEFFGNEQTWEFTYWN